MGSIVKIIEDALNLRSGCKTTIKTGCNTVTGHDNYTVVEIAKYDNEGTLHRSSYKLSRLLLKVYQGSIYVVEAIER